MPDLGANAVRASNPSLSRVWPRTRAEIRQLAARSARRAQPFADQRHGESGGGRIGALVHRRRRGTASICCRIRWPGALTDLAVLLTPELQRRGLFRTEYEGATLRANLGLSGAT